MQICSIHGVDKKKNSLIPIQADAWRQNRSEKHREVDRAKALESVGHSDSPSGNSELSKEVSTSLPAETITAEKPEVPDSDPAVGVLKKRKISLAKPKSLQSIETNAPVIKEEFKPELREGFDVSQLQEVWRAFSQEQKEAEKLNLSSTLLACSVELEGESVEIEFLNKVQEEQVNEIRVELFEYLRLRLKNDFIELNFKVAASESLEVSSQFLTERERYDVFVEKNPHLDTLRKRLDLDLG
jgi:DNA polymerase-3 subunit gamma/tau